MADEKALEKRRATGLVGEISAELEGVNFEGAEVIATGGVTKWVDLREFMDDPDAGDKDPVKGNGKTFAGVLLSRERFGGEETAVEDKKVRHFYRLRLVAPCPVVFKDENKDEISEIAKVGEIVCIGERHHLKLLQPLCEDGGEYLIAIRPNSRIAIGGGQTLWTFDVVKKTLVAPTKAVQAAPF